ncbi:unnamed protein product, partial [Protopolystoma xenopodis]
MFVVWFRITLMQSLRAQPQLILELLDLCHQTAVSLQQQQHQQHQKQHRLQLSSPRLSSLCTTFSHRLGSVIGSLASGLADLRGQLALAAAADANVNADAEVSQRTHSPSARWTARLTAFVKQAVAVDWAVALPKQGAAEVCLHPVLDLLVRASSLPSWSQGQWKTTIASLVDGALNEA